MTKPIDWLLAHLDEPGVSEIVLGVGRPAAVRAAEGFRAITSMNFYANLHLVAGGSLLAVAPRAAALSMRKELDLVLFAIDWGREDAAVTLVWREASLGNPALVALLECF